MTRNRILNFITILLLVTTVVLGGLFVLVFVNPGMFPISLQPPSGFSAGLIPTATDTPLATGNPATSSGTDPSATTFGNPTRTRTAPVPDTPSPTPTRTKTATPGPTPTGSLTPTATGAATPTATATNPTPTPSRTLSALSFTGEDGGPVYKANDVNPSGCDWSGVGGQVFDLAGQPVTGLLVSLEGAGPDPLLTLTGGAPAYGPGGYEFFLDIQPTDTVDVYRVQLVDTNEAPLSEPIPFDTFADCEKNLILINFVQNH